MSIADKLTAIANNVPLVFEAGKAAGGGNYVPVEEKDVNFWDYDGALLHSYTLEEAQALTELPPLPTRPGLICQEWNWDLADIKDHNRKLDVGATYITDDGKTRLYIELGSETALDVTVWLKATVENGVVVNWGDGSADEPVSVAGTTTIAHTYSSAGKYVITFEVVSGTFGFGDGNTSGIISVSGNKSTGLYKVETGNGLIGTRYNTFKNSSIRFISVSKSIASVDQASFYSSSVVFFVTPKGATIGASAFQMSRALKRFSFPSTFSGSTPSNLFYAASSLESAIIPDDVTTIDSSCFRECPCLREMTVPKSVTSIKSNALYYCSKIAVLRFMPEVPPVVEAANAFSGLNANIVVEVPAASLTAYQEATNYSGIAARMVGV